MHLCLNVSPADKFEAVAEAIAERFGVNFDDNGDGTGYLSYGRTTWADIDPDLRALSAEMPDVVIGVQVDGDDDAEWMDWYKAGKSYLEERPTWTPQPFDESKLK